MFLNEIPTMEAQELPMSDLCGPPPLFNEDDSSCMGLGSSAKAEEGKIKKVKKPKRILHFSDGTLEEYSTDEEEEKEKSEPDAMAMMNPKSLTWGPWMYYWMLYSGSSALAACDYVGESLANFLGITSAKYQYEIDEYQRNLEEEKERKQAEDLEMAGWTSPGSAESNADQVVPGSAVENPPSPAHSLKQNQDGSSKPMDINTPNNVIPSVIITSETDDIKQDAEPQAGQNVPSTQDSTDWERF